MMPSASATSRQMLGLRYTPRHPPALMAVATEPREEFLVIRLSRRRGLLLLNMLERAIGPLTDVPATERAWLELTTASALTRAYRLPITDAAQRALRELGTCDSDGEDLSIRVGCFDTTRMRMAGPGHSACAQPSAVSPGFAAALVQAVAGETGLPFRLRRHD